MASFHMPTSPKSPVKSFPVPVKCLDNYQFQNVSFIKIDVEGYEYEVISGARETIKTSKPILLVEIEQRHLQFQSMQEVFEGILRLGYQGSFFYKNQRLDITKFSYNDHQAPVIEQLVRDGYAPGYVNNFIFEPLQPSSS